MFKESSVRGITFRYPLQNAWFLMPSTNLLCERLQIDTDVLHNITSTAKDLSGGNNIDDLERPWNSITRRWILVKFLRLRPAFEEWIFAEITGDRPRRPAHEIELMLSRVSWAWAQICFDVVVWLRQAYVSEEPMVAFVCNRPAMHSTDNGWVRDDSTNCISDPVDVLNYCRKVRLANWSQTFWDLQATNVHAVKIASAAAAATFLRLRLTKYRVTLYWPINYGEAPAGDKCALPWRPELISLTLRRVSHPSIKKPDEVFYHFASCIDSCVCRPKQRRKQALVLLPPAPPTSSK